MKKMKTKLTLFCLGCALASCGGNINTPENNIIGEWINPYNYETGDIKGFNLKKGGEASTLNIPSLDIRSWEMKDSALIKRGYEITENGDRIPYEISEKILYLSKDSLRLEISKTPPRITFLFVKKSFLDKNKK